MGTSNSYSISIFLFNPSYIYKKKISLLFCYGAILEKWLSQNGKNLKMAEEEGHKNGSACERHWKFKKLILSIFVFIK
ncbi:unnamed protein product [Blepharisma stoltei]|uniref:Uncharacterized protein n=1 Tax=Blepharisma stoltei TaxID=1481888 RepID=A0AAU9KIY7_9CILI|nr:unnamed protein product [Blepharisma stoltei]